MGLFTAVPAWRNRKIILRHWPKLALYGALSSALFQALSYRAAETTTATNMAIVTALIPLLSMLLSVVVLRDPLTLGMAVGGVLSFLGLLYLVGQGDMLAVFHNGVHVGDGLMLLAAFSYALYGVLLRHWKVPLPAWQSTFVQSFFALLYMLPLFLKVPAAQAALDVKTVPLILYAGIFSSVLLSFLWIEGVHRLGPNSLQHLHQPAAAVHRHGRLRAAARAAAWLPPAGRRGDAGRRAAGADRAASAVRPWRRRWSGGRQGLSSPARYRGRPAQAARVARRADEPARAFKTAARPARTVALFCTGAPMSIFQSRHRAGAQSRRRPPHAGHRRRQRAGQPLCRRRHDQAGGGDRRACASVTASALAVLSG